MPCQFFLLIHQVKIAFFRKRVIFLHLINHSVTIADYKKPLIKHFSLPNLWLNIMSDRLSIYFIMND